MSATVSVTLQVKVATQKGDKVGVTGSFPCLGSWDPLKFKLMKPKKTIHDGNFWVLKIEVPLSSQRLEYRYLVVRRLRSTHEDEEDNNYLIRHWEAGIHCRSKAILELGNAPMIDIYGEFPETSKMFVDQGWLLGETEIQIRFFNNPIRMFKRQKPRYNVRCYSVNLFVEGSGSDGSDDDHFDERIHASNPLIRVTCLGTYKNKEQRNHGMPVGADDYVVYKLRTIEFSSHGIKIDFYECESDSSDICDDSCSESSKYLGCASLLPVHLKDGSGAVTLAISNARGFPIGEVRLRYMVCKPHRASSSSAPLSDFSRSFTKWWKSGRPCLEIGHRGVGDTHATDINSTNEAEKRKAHENTIAALNTAARSGADFVEFDVQLTKDMVPIIWHDFCVSILLRKKRKGEHRVHHIPVHELSHSQLVDLRVEFVKPGVAPDQFDSSEPDQDTPTDLNLKPFPTLQKAFETVDITTGFYIELKYPQHTYGESVLREDGLTSYMDRNSYMDAMLNVILKQAGGRRIVLASFDPDICIMSRLKQNKYPVIYLVEDLGPDVQPFYKDYRTHSISRALLVARSEKFLGLSVNAAALLRGEEELSAILKERMICFVWGPKANDKDVRTELKSRGVHAICYDQIQEHRQGPNIYRLEHDEKSQKVLQQFSQPTAGVSLNGFLSSDELSSMGSTPDLLTVSSDPDLTNRCLGPSNQSTKSSNSCSNKSVPEIKSTTPVIGKSTSTSSDKHFNRDYDEYY